MTGATPMRKWRLFRKTNRVASQARIAGYSIIEFNNLDKISVRGAEVVAR
jgi:hypothetical protein